MGLTLTLSENLKRVKKVTVEGQEHTDNLEEKDNQDIADLEGDLSEEEEEEEEMRYREMQLSRDDEDLEGDFEDMEDEDMVLHGSGEYFEGDLDISQELIEAYYGGANAAIQTNTVRSLRRKWPRNTLVYEFHQKMQSKIVKQVIYEAIEEWENRTCIRFRHRSTQYRNYGFVVFQAKKKGCYISNVGYKGNRKPVFINLQMWDCVHKQIVLHMIGHALGYWHEQTRPDRDNYVEILYENIQKGKERYFRKRSRKDADTHGLMYDYGSIMHSRKDFFSKNGKDTIAIAEETEYSLQGSPILGEATTLSTGDAEGINLLYMCPAEEDLYSDKLVPY